MRHVSCPGIDRLVTSPRGGGHELITLCEHANIRQSGITRDGTRALPDKFHAVVVLGIMAGGHHNAATNAQVCRREINLFGSTQPDILH